VPIAALLLDQQVIAGVGNVYRAEVLYRHGVYPLREGRSLDYELWSSIWKDLVALMRVGVRTGRIDTVRPEHEPSVTGRAPRKDRHGGEVYVYRRAGMPCLACGAEIQVTELAGRRLYWCPTEQPAP
jgi:endonuclease VIII